MSSPNASHCVLPSAVMGRTNSTQSFNNQNFPWTDGVDGPTRVGYHFKLTPWSFLSVIQFLTISSPLCCRCDTQQQLCAYSHRTFKGSRYEIPCLVENELSKTTLSTHHIQGLSFPYTTLFFFS